MIQPILSPRLLDAHTFQSCRPRTFKIHSLFVIVCTRLNHTVTAFVVAWQFKHKVSNFSRIRNILGGIPVALISFISIVGYIFFKEKETPML